MVHSSQPGPPGGPAGPTALPYGKSIFWALVAEDPAPAWLSLLKLLVSCVVSCVALPYLPRVLAAVLGLDAGWDHQHHCGKAEMGPDGLLENMRILGRAALDYSESGWELTAALAFGFVPYAVLLFADALGAAWPESWDTDNRICYTSMFSEPLRTHAYPPRASLVGHLGNTVSNAFYLAGGASVLMAARSSLFPIGDCMFGVMLVILGAASTMWHASNAPISHYVDLWSMHSCIVYVMIRFISLGILHTLNLAGRDIAPLRNEVLAGAVCALLYARAVVQIGRTELDNCRKGTLDGESHFAGRFRLLNKGDPLQKDICINDVCVYVTLPVFYLVVPTLVQLFIGAAGSLYAATVMATSLAVGWGLRNFDRWVFDGWLPMNLAIRGVRRCQGRGGAAVFWYVMAAAVSPTAILHWGTGITLWFFYFHVRTVDMYMS